MLSQHSPPNLHIDNQALARNVAILFTFIGAASYTGMAVPNPSILLSHSIPGASEVINTENSVVLRDTLLKMAMAGGFLKAGVQMKEAASRGVIGSVGGGNRGEGRETASNTSIEEGGDHATTPRPSDRSSSMGSLEDLTRMLPAAITSRIYNPFSNSSSQATNADALPPSSASAHNILEGHDYAEEKQHEDAYENSKHPQSPPRQHRDKRSHATIHRGDAGCIDAKDESCAGEEKEVTAEQSQLLLDNLNTQQHDHNSPTKEAMEYAMKNPITSNPYDHVAAHRNASTSNSNNNNGTSSFFSFITNPSNNAVKASTTSPLDSNKVPSGCIGAYANTVKTAAQQVTCRIKEERKCNFEALSPDEQFNLGIRFIDACSSDDKLSIVKEILQTEKRMDVDRFFIGPDETETCALHAAAFNGAEKVLEFLCGGIDERDPDLDCGLCDVDIRDGNGWTALHFAAGANSVSSVRILAEHGANLTIEAGNGYTPYHWAERLSNEEVAQELERLGADNRFVGRWMFGSSSARGERKFVTFLTNRFFAFSR
jgi:ankyrin repeat protein